MKIEVVFKRPLPTELYNERIDTLKRLGMTVYHCHTCDIRLVGGAAAYHNLMTENHNVTIEPRHNG